MKVKIDHNDNLPEGEYELTDPNKLENAKGNIASPASDRQILLEYDRIAGRIVKDRNVLPPQSLWNTEKNRPIEQYSEEEILAVLRRAENTDVSGSLYQKARNEWQQRQQEENLNQTASLINEIRELKNITDDNAKTSAKNADSANLLAKVAISIAIASLITQVLFSTHQRVRCGSSYSSNTEPTRYIDCYRTFDLGLFGERTYKIPDFIAPQETK